MAENFSSLDEYTAIRPGKFNWPGVKPEARNSKYLYIISAIIVLLTIIASSGSLFIPNLYRDTEFIKTAWRGNDMVTLLAVVPVFFTILVLSYRSSERAEFIWLGLLGYIIYNYAF